MQPEQPTTPVSGDTNYDFIINPQQDTKRGILSSAGKDPFITKIAILLGGTVLVLGVLAFVINLIFGGKTNINTITALTQTQQEIVRLSTLEKDAVDQTVKNAAVNTNVTLTSHQQKWLAYLETHGTKLKSEQLALKRDSKTDNRLELAIQTSTFDATYTTVIRTQLTTYANDLKAAYNGKSTKQQRALLNAQYRDVALLLKQWPVPSTDQ
jgi:hypothetical protein